MIECWENLPTLVAFGQVPAGSLSAALGSPRGPTELGLWIRKFQTLISGGLSFNEAARPNAYDGTMAAGNATDATDATVAKVTNCTHVCS